MSLNECLGKTAQISAIDLPDSEAHRLRCLGVYEGQSVTVQRLGSAVVLSAAGCRVAIARELAMRILVEPTC